MSAGNPSLGETQELLRKMAAEARELQSAAGGSVTDTVAGWLAAHYASAAHEKLTGAEGAHRWEVLRAFVQDWSLLRRGDHTAARLQLDREELEWQRANGKLQKEKDFREWVNRPEIHKELFPDRTGGISQETMQKIERELKLL
jgi:hypothetical protein